jgi:hypothetical protein
LNLAKLDDGLAESTTVMVGDKQQQQQQQDNSVKIGAFVKTKNKTQGAKSPIFRLLFVANPPFNEFKYIS